MSKEFLDKLLNDVFTDSLATGKAVKTARKMYAQSGTHFIELTKKDIYDIISINYLYVIERTLLDSIKARKEAQKSGEKFLLGDAARERLNKNTKQAENFRNECTKLAEKIYKLFVANYPKPRKGFEHFGARYKKGSIQIFQRSLNDTSIRDTLMKILEMPEINKGTSFVKLFKEKNKQHKEQFEQAIQFHHEGSTVGSYIVESLATWKPKVDSQAMKAAQKIIEDFLESLDVKWKSKDSFTKREIALFVVASGKMGPRLFNYPGSDSNDWKVLRPLLEEDLEAQLSERNKKQLFASGEGSQPFDERLAKNLINKELFKTLRKKGAKIKDFKVDKPKSHSKEAPKKKNLKEPKPGRITNKKLPKPKIRKQAPRKGVAAQPLYLIGILNERLPETIKENMGSPRLNYRTGRFADSVKVTDVITTPQGFPSIGYTYRKSPYQTFEVGHAKGTTDLDPRKLIDSSLREIAANLAMARFYTRRV